MKKELLERLDHVINSIDTFCVGLDMALKILVEEANKLPIKEQNCFKNAITLILDHIESGVKEARYALHPVTDSVKEYSR